MQNLHVLYQLLIPALFLVLWALNQLFNKEAAGANRPGGGLGPRPGGAPPTPRPRPRPAHQPEPIGARPAGEDEIMILESEPRRLAESRRPSNAPNRKPSRSGQNRPGRKPLSGSSLPKAMDTKTGKPGSFAQASGLTTQTTQTSQVTSVSEDRATAGLSAETAKVESAFSSARLRESLGDLNRVREALVMQEIFQPPVSVRVRRRP